MNATAITCTIAARVEGPATERDARYGIRPMTVCGQPAVSFSEADGHRSYYCPTHAARVEARGLYTRPVG
jgi:hypothetical protein